MQIEALRILVEVARRGSIAAVARDHDTEPSTVSRLVAGLEAELGFRVLQRTTRRMAPTEAGALYLQRAEQLIDAFEAAREEARAVNSGPSGILRLSASVAFGTTLIIPALAEFRGLYPQVALDLMLTDDVLDLVEDRIDLAVRLAPSIDAAVISSKLMATRYRVVAAPDYLAAAPRLAEPADLARHKCLMFALPDYRSSWLFRAADGTVTDVPVAGDIRISNALALFSAAHQGLGPALLPDWLVDPDIARGALVDVFPGYDAAATSFDTAAWLIYPSRSFLPNKVRVFIDFLRARLGRR